MTTKPNQLNFDQTTPLAPHGLGGLVRDHFGNGRIFATVCAHGGLTDIAYWGRQHLGASHFFHGDPQSAWVKLLRVYAGLGDSRYYLPLNDTRLYPFGYTSHAEVGGVALAHDLLLLPDALVHRLRVVRNPGRHPVRIEALHQEACTATTRDNRNWRDWTFVPKLNAVIASCTDREPGVHRNGEDSLAQGGLPATLRDNPKATTWIGVGCDSTLNHHRGYHPRSKHYLAGSNINGKSAALFLVFAHSRPALVARLAALAQTVQDECDALLAGYHSRLRSRPRIDTGDKLLNSAFSQYPECIQQMKIPDRPGAIRATLAGYWVWGWDGLTAPFACNLANEPEYAVAALRFFQQTRNREVGIPHAFTSTFKPFFRGPFPAQCQYITALYHSVSITGDLAPVRELMPTCRFILDRCRDRRVADTGLVAGHALWPDYPEAMEETGHDISSMNNSLLYQGLRAMEYLEAAVGNTRNAAECRDWARRLRASFVAYLYDPDRGYFISSCDSVTLQPRKHYCAQAVFWLTPFARELVAHAPGRIADFMERELRSDKCLLTLPHWDRAWMADGNQLGSTFPAADHFYLNLHKLMANAAGLDQWLGDVAWFWSQHTAPEAFTPEAVNESVFGVDNPGCKQLQAVSTWYVGLYAGLAGLDFDHEGVTLTPWGDRPLSIKGLRLRGIDVDLKIDGAGCHVGVLKLDGQRQPAGSRKLLWSQFKGTSARIVLVRSEQAPTGPVVVRADGLRVDDIASGKGRLSLRVSGSMAGELVVQAPADATLFLDDQRIQAPYEAATGTFAIPCRPGAPVRVVVAPAENNGKPHG